jgi:hypothetical protein
MRTLRSQGLVNFIWRLKLIHRGRRQARQSRSEGLLHALNIGCRQFVLLGERPMRPKRGVIAG